MIVLAFFAHPDDETMLSGGTLALLANQGAKMHYLCATRGEGGETGDPPICEREQLGAIREQEMACAVQALGGGDLEFMDYSDPEVGPGEELYPYTGDLEDLLSQTLAYLRKIRPSVVLTHGSNGEYGHPAHIITHQAARQAIETLALSGEGAPALYSVQAFFPNHPKPRLANQDDPADLVLDTSSVNGQKTQAALCHRTQHALFVRRASIQAGRQLEVPEVITEFESLRKVLPTNPEPDEILTPLLKPWSIDY